MQSDFKNLCFSSVFSLLGLVFVGTGFAADAVKFPNRPIKLIAPFAPGGALDVVARTTGEVISEQLGQPVVVENRAGASGVIGSAAVARAEPDGYTLLMGNISTLGINPAVIKELGYDPVKSFTPVSLVAVQPLIVAVSTQTPANSMTELVALAKSKPGGLFYGTSGSSYQLVTEAFSEALGIKMTHVPFKGSSPAIEAMMSNQINVIFDPFSTIYAQVKAGRIRGLAMTTKNRSDIAPDLPLVEMDAILMERVFSNLLENAAKFSPPGSTIRVHARRQGASVCIDVRDQGTGFVGLDGDFVTERFKRGALANMQDGLGLGLSICQMIIKAHGGDINLLNRPDGGACVEVVLKLGHAPQVLQES